KPAYDAYHAFIASHTHTSAVDDARLSTADIPNTMEAGQTIQVSVAMTNAGTTVWTAAQGYKLGAVGDSDPFASPRQLLAAGESIAPGQTRVFTFPYTAPAKSGSYTSDWQMVREGVHFFGATYAKTVTVNAAPAPAARNLALLGGRFRVAVSWRDQHNNQAGYGRAVPDSDETGFFWFFSSANVELVVKLLDGRPLNGRFWFFYGALSDVEYWIDVTDTATGQVHEYHNAPGNICGRGDTAAFPLAAGTAAFSITGGAAASAEPALAARRLDGPAWRGGAMLVKADPPAAATAAGAATSAAASCSPDARTLCLLGGRFQVSVDWHDQHNSRNGQGTAIPGTDETGTFWFFDPANVELVVKLLDGRALNGKFWVFYGALSDVEYSVNVKDLATGIHRAYHNDPGNICGVGDTGAF
ncbi:MAG TPA: NBR1-Ig-like domain-containing protein, partial [Thermoanaerobaculia bacterium]|nr:NBR1-Ig-like domain-containing protein [Thermoanaerobaculia bacterium]